MQEMQEMDQQVIDCFMPWHEQQYKIYIAPRSYKITDRPPNFLKSLVI